MTRSGNDFQPGSFHRKVSKGVLWVTAASICAKVLNVTSAIILARLMAPLDFGLLAIATAIIFFSQGTTQTGFESALIQKQNRPEDFLNPAWTFELVRYLILFLIIFLAAPVLGQFFKEPRAVAIIRVISLSLVFQGLRNIGVVYFRKDFDFHKQFILEIVPLIVYISIVIPLAFSLRNVWALVLASLAASLATCIISYGMHPYRPKLDFNFKKAKSLFNFGKWILGTSILSMVRDQGTTMFVGRFIGIPTLGFYNRADGFSSAIFQQLNDIVWKVGYPAYSQIHGDPGRFKNAYLKTLQLLTFIGIPMAGGLLVLSREFVHLFLTDKWLSIVPLMQLLCLQAMLGFINTSAFVAFQASGNPAFGAKISLLGVIILGILAYPLSSRWGINGTVWSLLLSVLIPSPVIWYATIKLIKCTYLEFFKPIAFSVIGTVVMSFAIITAKKYLMAQIEFMEFFGLIAMGIFFYTAITLAFEKVAHYEVLGLIRERIAALG